MMNKEQKKTYITEMTNQFEKSSNNGYTLSGLDDAAIR